MYSELFRKFIFLSMFVSLNLADGRFTAAEELTPRDWPQFHRDGARTGDNPQAGLSYPLQRTLAVRFPAPIYASPAVVGDKVFIQDAWGNVAAVDARTNHADWTTSLGGFNNTSSPAVHRGKVYVGSSVDGLVILNAADGKVVQKVPGEGGVLTAPAIANDAVYFSTFGGKLIKTDLEGNVMWSFSGGRLSTADFSILGKNIIFFAGTSQTIIYQLQDEGASVKVVKKTSAPSNCYPMGGPVQAQPGLFAFQSFDSEFGRFYCMKDEKSLISGDISDSRVTPAVREGKFYRGDKCFTLDPGLKQLWRADTEFLYDGGFHSSPALARDLLVVGCERGLVHFVSLEGKDKVRKPVWQYRTVRAGEPNSAVSSSPAVVDGAVYFGGEDGILYGLSQGKEVPTANLAIPQAREPNRGTALKGSEWPTPGGDAGFSFVSDDTVVRPPFKIGWKTRIWSVFKAPMVVADNKVFCGGRLGNLTALDAGTGEILWKFHHPGVESRPGPTYLDGKLLIPRTRNAQGDSPYVSGASGGPAGEGLWCHDAADGKVLWHKPMKVKYHFNHDGLAVDRQRVYVLELDSRGAVQAVAFALDSGREVWRHSLEDHLPPQVKKVVKLPPRFSGVLAGGLWCVSISDRATLGLDPASGKVVWKNEKCITNRSRIGAREDVLLVFNNDGDFAMDARTGRDLWKGAATASRYSQALTDRFMKSEGQEGVYPPAVCAWPVFANGYWYSHRSYSSAHGSNQLAGIKEPEGGKIGLLGEKLVAWSFDFLSNACPAPSPAYGRLYYSPAAEGVIYSFVPVPGGNSPTQKKKTK